MSDRDASQFDLDGDAAADPVESLFTTWANHSEVTQSFMDEAADQLDSLAEPRSQDSLGDESLVAMLDVYDERRKA